MSEQLAEELIRDQENLASDRSGFEQQWQEISERTIPRSSEMFFTQGTYATKGQKKTEKMLDSTAAIALDRYSAVTSSLMTPQDAKWHRLRSTYPELNRNPRVSRWFDAATDILFRRRRAPKSGFYGQVNELYTSTGAFGTGVWFIDLHAPTPTDRSGGLRYRFIHISQVFLRENHQGVIDTVFRKFPLKHRQVEGMIASGYFDKPPKDLEKLLASPHNKDKSHDYIHVVAPNGEFDPGRLDYRGMPWASYYVCVQTKEIVGRSGFYSFPYPACRATVTPGEVYGRSPAMAVLPNIKVLNEQKRVQLKMGHRLADPILLAHDDGILDTYSARPGTVTSGGLNAQGQKLLQRLDDNVGQMPELKDLMEQERVVINDAFLVTLFQILTETPRMTATEVLERTREKSILLAPSMARQQGEFLGGTIDRELDLMIRAQLMPPMPQELIEAEGEYEVHYDSPLSRVMRAEEAAGLSRWMEQTLAAVNVTQDPAPLDWVEWDVVQPELADINAVPARWVSTPEKVAQKREDRQQAATVQQAIDAGPSVASLIKAGGGGA